MRKFRSTFKIGSSSGRDFVYLGLEFSQHTGGISIGQRSYIEKLPDKVKLESEKHLKGILGKLEWISGHTRPDIAFDLVSLRKLYLEDANKAEHMAVKLIRKLKHSSDHKIWLPKLFNPPKWKLIVYADASFANGSNESTQGAYIIFICDEQKNCCPVAWQSNKVSRIVHSTFAGETLAMVAALDCAIFLQAEFQFITGFKMPVHAFSDNKSLVNSVYSMRPALEKRLRIDIASICELLEKEDVKSLSWIDNKFQLANCLTKKSCEDKRLMACLRSGQLPFIDAGFIKS